MHLESSLNSGGFPPQIALYSITCSHTTLMCLRPNLYPNLLCSPFPLLLCFRSLPTSILTLFPSPHLHHTRSRSRSLPSRWNGTQAKDDKGDKGKTGKRAPLIRLVPRSFSPPLLSRRGVLAKPLGALPLSTLCSRIVNQRLTG